jgi:hypothetical protein
MSNDASVEKQPYETPELQVLGSFVSRTQGFGHHERQGADWFSHNHWHWWWHPHRHPHGKDCFS